METIVDFEACMAKVIMRCEPVFTSLSSPANKIRLFIDGTLFRAIDRSFKEPRKQYFELTPGLATNAI